MGFIQSKWVTAAGSFGLGIFLLTQGQIEGAVAAFIVGLQALGVKNLPTVPAPQPPKPSLP